VDLIIDCGPAEHGIASTIVDCAGAKPRVLREGAVGREAIIEALAG
jgi:tRNA A37 threonylcarbamoyladenosine synthetase subunit TsaC/SUA5/YrdC